jgi:hypothetical protein
MHESEESMSENPGGHKFHLALDVRERKIAFRFLFGEMIQIIAWLKRVIVQQMNAD